MAELLGVGEEGLARLRGRTKVQAPLGKFVLTDELGAWATCYAMHGNGGLNKLLEESERSSIAANKTALDEIISVVRKEIAEAKHRAWATGEHMPRGEFKLLRKREEEYTELAHVLHKWLEKTKVQAVKERLVSSSLPVRFMHAAEHVLTRAEFQRIYGLAMVDEGKEEACG